MNIPYLIGLLTLSIILLSNCKEAGVVHNEVVDVDPYGWDYSDTKSFEKIPIEKGQELFIRVLHDNNYKYENIYLQVVVTQNSTELYKKNISISLTNGKGQWAGKQKNGALQIDYLIKDILPKKLQNSKITIAQYSRDESLRGVESIGVVLVEREDEG